MKLIVAAVFALLAVSAYAEEPEIDWSKVIPISDLPGFWDGREIRPAFYPEDKSRTGRIVGGAVVTPHAHPYQAGLLVSFSTGTVLCGGSVVSASVVLTSAHCIFRSFSVQVILGAHQITANEANQQRRMVSSTLYRVHNAYSPSTFNNDIATLIMSSPVVANQFVRWTNLPALGSTELFVGELATVTGWGATSDNISAGSPLLRSVQNNIITNAVCAATYGNYVIASTICMTTVGGRGSCNGDSGGPLTVVRGGNRLQIGVASFGATNGCERGSPIGFARLTSFRQWINNNSS